MSNSLPNVVKRITNDLGQNSCLRLRFESLISIIRNEGTNHYTVKFTYDAPTTYITCGIEDNCCWEEEFCKNRFRFLFKIGALAAKSADRTEGTFD